MPSTNETRDYLRNLRTLQALPVKKSLEKFWLREYPFDLQLLSASKLYLRSRKLYIALGGEYRASICSTMRSLSAQDLFRDEIQFTPSMSELSWFMSHADDVTDPEQEMVALNRFNEISLYHEQNHRILWRLLPPAPDERADVTRYLNFAESLVVALDMALGDALGTRTAAIFEKLKIIYRPAGEFKKTPSKAEYRNYLLACVCATYFILETMHNDDILKAVDYVLPGQKSVNRKAVRRSLELSELFSRVTNPMWQERHWKSSAQKLSKMHQDSVEDVLYLPEDPLDLGAELRIALRAFEEFGL